MERAKSRLKVARKVWRISESAPLGEFVDPSTPLVRPVVIPPPEDSASEEGNRHWAVSSAEFLDGVDVSEEDPSTVPAELIDELFKPPKK